MLCRTDVMQDTHVMQQDTWVMQWDTWHYAVGHIMQQDMRYEVGHTLCSRTHVLCSRTHVIK